MHSMFCWSPCMGHTLVSAALPGLWLVRGNRVHRLHCWFLPKRCLPVPVMPQGRYQSSPSGTQCVSCALGTSPVLGQPPARSARLAVTPVLVGFLSTVPTASMPSTRRAPSA